MEFTKNVISGVVFNQAPRNVICYNSVVPLYFVQKSTDLVHFWTGSSANPDDILVQI
jgi:hypothetical protein